jgi:3(or 17)beta-hydroxysteroid dehydrogenase
LSRLGRPSDIANAVVFLASDESRMMNGADLVLDQSITIQEGFAP